VEDWSQLISESERVFHDREGMTYEYRAVEVYQHPTGRYIRRHESLHIDADVARVSHDWLEDPESHLAALRGMVAAREASGKPAFFDLNASDASNSRTSKGTAMQSAPNSTLTAALTALLQRTGGFVIVNEAGGRFVQFAGGVGEPLLLDVPNLDAAEGARASQAFAGQPFSITGNTFNLAYGQDAAAAAAGAETLFREVLGVPSPQFTLTEE